MGHIYFLSFFLLKFLIKYLVDGIQVYIMPLKSQLVVSSIKLTDSILNRQLINKQLLVILSHLEAM